MRKTLLAFDGKGREGKISKLRTGYTLQTLGQKHIPVSIINL